MKYNVIPPPEHLKNHVQCFWTFDVSDSEFKPFQVNSFVDDTVGIIFHCRTNGQSVLVKNSIQLDTAFVYGQSTVPTTINCKSGFSAVAVQFYPYAIKELFGIDAHYLTDELVNINEFSHWNITNALVEATDAMSRIHLISDFLTKKLLASNNSDPLIKNCISFIKHHQGVITIKELVQYYNISERQLERRFKLNIGVSPRHYTKVIRFNSVLDLLKKGAVDKLSDIAYTLNYADQSHFYRTIKGLSGHNPKLLQQKLQVSKLIFPHFVDTEKH